VSATPRAGNLLGHAGELDVLDTFFAVAIAAALFAVLASLRR